MSHLVKDDTTDAILHSNDNVNYMKVTEYIWNENIDKNGIIDIMKNINTPIVIRGLFKDTEACKNWNLENISDIFGLVPLKVDVEEETVQNIHKWEEDAINYKPIMKDLLNYFKYDSKPNLYVGQVPLNSLVDACSGARLSQSVIDDVKLNNIDDNYDLIENSLYFGKDASTEFHIHMTDDYLLSQVIGKKDVYLCDFYKNKDNIKSYTILDHITGNINSYGHADCYIENNKKKYRFLELDHSLFDELYKVTLNPGDTLFIPPWWWHAANGHDINLSITKVFERENINYFMDYPEIAIRYYFSSGTDYGIGLLQRDNYINYTIIFSLIFFISLFMIFNDYKYFKFVTIPYTYVYIFLFFILMFPLLFEKIIYPLIFTIYTILFK